VTWLYRLTTETNPNPNPKSSYSKSLVPAWSEHHHHKKELHWLPVTYRIQYKAAMLTYMVHDNRCPWYLRGSVVFAGSKPGRHDLCLATNLIYILPRTRTKFVESTFLGPLFRTVCFCPSDCRRLWLAFKRNLKSHFLTVLSTNFNVLLCVIWHCNA